MIVMYVFGIDLPLPEIIFVIAVISIIILIEIVIVLWVTMKKLKEVNRLVYGLIEVRKKEIEFIEKLKKI
ncbi:hypothetical protein DRJ19_05840 [Candidatus Woesearchaeota archaeon]|nr:MAG: hypothetical protein DRJ19_05840 [Candidatus Woesearchaeota archaeon]